MVQAQTSRNEWLTQKGVTERLGISKQMLSKLVAQGKLPYEESPHGRIYDPAVVDALRKERDARHQPEEPEPAGVAAD